MARRRRKNGPTVSLFPFLSILACVIGTLTLMITALALGQIDNPTVASAERFEKVKVALASVISQFDSLDKQLAEAKSGADTKEREAARLRTKVQELKIEYDRLVRSSSQGAAVSEIDVAALKKRIEELQKEIARIEELREKLAAQLAKRKKQPPEANVRIQPGGSGVDIDPVFVECASGYVLIHEGAKPTRVRTGDLATDETFGKLLSRIAGSEKGVVVFLLRDDGLGTYQHARNVARSRYARNGKLPVLGHGHIDLSLFRKK